MGYNIVKRTGAQFFVYTVIRFEGLVCKANNLIYTATCLPSRKLSKLDGPDMQDSAGEAGTNS